MTGHATHRRMVMIAVGFAVLAGAAMAQSADIVGTVGFAGGAAIPEGQIQIHLDDLAVLNKDQRRIAETRIASDGGSSTIGFSLARPAGAAVSPTLQIVARLERADGWLIARGSAGFGTNAPVHITLKAVVY